MCGNVYGFVCVCGYGSQLGSLNHISSSPCSNMQTEVVSVVFCKEL